MKNKILWLTALVLVMSMLTATAMADIINANPFTIHVHTDLKVGDLIPNGATMINHLEGDPTDAMAGAETATNGVGNGYASIYLFLNGNTTPEILGNSKLNSAYDFDFTNAPTTGYWEVTKSERRAADAGNDRTWWSWAYTIVPHKHSTSATIETPVDATCATKGQKGVYQCKCGVYSYTSDFASTVTAWTEAGRETPIDPDKHTAVQHGEAKASTCNTNGNVEYYFCSGCNNYYEDADCNKKTTEDAIKLGFDADGHKVRPGYVYDNGYHWQICENDCNQLLNKEKHNLVEVVDKEPTTEAAGLHHDECTICGFEFPANEIPAIPVPNLPATGDNSQLALWISLMAISSGILLGSKKFSCKTR